MTVLTARITLPDNASWAEREEAKIKAEWKEEKKLSTEERMAQTNLDNKCGSCEHFVLCPTFSSGCFGDCKAGHPWGKRTRPACKDYKRGETC